MGNQSDDLVVDSQLTLEWKIPSECKSEIRQVRIPLNGEILLRNDALEFDDLSVSIAYSSFVSQACEQKLRRPQLEPGASYSISLPTIESPDGVEFAVSSEECLQITVCVEADGGQVLKERRNVKILPPAQLSVDVASVYSIAFQQNQFPLISRLDLTNQSPKPFGLTQVVATFDPPDFDEVTWNIDALASGQSVSLRERMLKLSAGALDALTEKQLVSLKISVFTEETLLFETVGEIELLPKNHWGGEMHMPELLAAFVTPNIHYCDRLLKKASNLLAQDGHESKLDGYQSNTRERPYMVAAALWSVICGEGISYCVPPSSFATTGQKIRLGRDISASLLATCLDSALLFASCLEQAGLNCVIALTKGHALVGIWLLDECFPLVTSDDPVDLRNRIALKDLILFETTLVTNDRPVQFAQAIREADRKIAEDVEDDFVYVIDLKQARSRKINPIDFGSDHDSGSVEKIERVEVELPPAPVLPPVAPQIPLGEISSADRVDQWRRKLLDLSKRNKLLNIRQRSMGFRIICPDLDLLEDELAAGKKFKVISKDQLLSDGRSTDQYMAQTGNNLEDDFVRDQLHRGSLIAGSNERDLEKNLINLFRRAKSDLEEGGSNTLFLSIGMLRWKEDARSEQSYKAPLILLPVKLERTSVRARPKIMQLPDEEPVFNLTLIEFLLKDFEIDLSMFQRALPKDNSGVDVVGIWNTVRTKIKDTPGFEVVEDLVLSNFSFAKYLMWKDLSDRIDDLKKSPFVNHLVEKPADPYPFKTEFIDLCAVDEKIDPTSFYAPLNADSSQIVAIDASAKGADFVLEGPPGTGKSETIANMIAHNMALGRKVLFVSEKMAALDVVYSRLKKAGLDHLCLELHSNKASKKSVMDQLNEAWQVRESASQEDWTKKAEELGVLRRELNRYVEELHKKSELGYSVREAIARSVQQKPYCRVDLQWPRDLATAPVRTKGDVQRAVALAKDLGLAFKDRDGACSESFSLVTVSEWSNLWQSKLIDAAGSLRNSLVVLHESCQQFRASFIPEEFREVTFNSLGNWAAIAGICMKCRDESYKFALCDKSMELIVGVDHLASLKKQYDELVTSDNGKFVPDVILGLPVKDWIVARDKLRYHSKDRIEQCLFEQKIIESLELSHLPIAVDLDDNTVELINGFGEAEKSLRDIYKCTLCFAELIRLPAGKWLTEMDADGGSISSRFKKEREICGQLRDSGFNVSDDLITTSPIIFERHEWQGIANEEFEWQVSLQNLRGKFSDLMTQCECSLSSEEIINLSVEEWINFRDEAAKKGLVVRLFARRKLIKLMRRSGLKKADNLDCLDSYRELVEIAGKIHNLSLRLILGDYENLLDKLMTPQSMMIDRTIGFYDRLVAVTLELDGLFTTYAGDGVLNNWSSTPERMLEKKDEGVSIRQSLYSVAGQLQEPAAFMATVRKKLVDEREFLGASPLFKQAEKVLSLYRETTDAMSGFTSLAGASNVEEIQFDDLLGRLDEIISSAPHLNAWCHWNEAADKASSAGLSALVRALEAGVINWAETESQFETALCIWLAPLLVDASQVLCRFSAVHHEDTIRQFRALDKEVSETTGQFIASKLAADMPETSGPNAPHEYGVLSRELQRQRGHKPVRQLVQELGGCLLDLTPCFMMSPLSVAQYLPSDYQAFDLVVFDEASQITVWDAVGAIARGKNVIVVGDPKQMPPTNFFNRAQDDGDGEEADLESILDQAMAARADYHRLTGHYRSRHESLIAFSNHQYYDNSLTTYPCADTRESAVIWHRVDGLYSKGAARNNPVEAQAVVAEVVRRLQDPELQKLSIGIVTLNSEQQQLIENLLDDERRKDTSLEQFFKEDRNESVFVKNLETVQGDQRDVICLSVGYGPTEPGAQTMSMNFGPLNRQGGERRLNVAITRASTEMLVFTSFDAAMIDLSRTSAQAVKDLKGYIDYAARGPVALAQRTEFVHDADQFDSEFEEAVATQLREKGWDLRTQIGVSKFRIDLGVLNPDVGGSFLAGIECDGATYHSSPSARDRDRVRHIILENLGWKLVRIWSTDYFINPKKVIDRVHAQLEELQLEAREEREVLEDDDPVEDIPEEFDETVGIDDENVSGQAGRVLIASCASVFPDSEVEEYQCYEGDVMSDPRESDTQIVADGLVDIVQIEGPMLAKHAYDVYLRHCGIKRMGKDLKSMMNRAMQHAINAGKVCSEDEWRAGGIVYSIVRSPEQRGTRLRTLGNRKIDEIPPSEIRDASKVVLSENNFSHGGEEHLRGILSFYGLKRLTDHTRDRLIKALGGCE